MPMPVVSLPVVQRWDCHSCGECCRSYAVRVTPVEKARIEAQGWAARPDFDGLPGVVPDDGPDRFRLNQRPDGSCVFLGADDRCRIHAEFGAAAKPMSCRLYPFVLVPAGDHWRVSLRLACPSAVRNDGRPVADHAADLREYAGLLEASTGVTLTAGAQAVPPPPLQPGHAVPWADLIRFAQSLGSQVADDAVPLDYRLRQVLAVSELCQKSRFESISGARLSEFLAVVTAAVAEDVPRHAADVARPSWLGRTVFRQMAAVYARKDSGTHAGIAVIFDEPPIIIRNYNNAKPKQDIGHYQPAGIRKSISCKSTQGNQAHQCRFNAGMKEYEWYGQQYQQHYHHYPPVFSDLDHHSLIGNLPIIQTGQ